MPTLLRPLFLSLGFLLLNGCAHVAMVPSQGGPLPILVLPAGSFGEPPAKYVMLRLDYGVIIHNTKNANAGPVDYYLFLRGEKRIMKTQDVRVFLNELARLPDGSKIDVISKCTVPFHVSGYGIDMDKEEALISALMKKKRFVEINSRKDPETPDTGDDKHADFCYCETGFRILSEQEARQLLDKGIPKDAVYSEK